MPPTKPLLGAGMPLAYPGPPTTHAYRRRLFFLSFFLSSYITLSHITLSYINNAEFCNCSTPAILTVLKMPK